MNQIFISLVSYSSLESGVRGGERRIEEEEEKEEEGGKGMDTHQRFDFIV